MKRILLIAAIALMTGGAASAQAPAPPGAPARPLFETTKVADNVYAFRYDNHQSMFVVTPEGVIVTDPIALRRPEAARQYMAEIRKITQAPIRYLIYSHTHYDHSAGGKVFKEAGARVVAHRLARDRLLKVSIPEVVPVDEVVDQRRTIQLGGTRLDLIYMGRSHSDNMLVMHLPKEKIVFAVDWASVDGPPYRGFMLDTYPDEWVSGLRELARLDWDRMIIGHAGRLGTKADVQLQIDYMTDVKAAAKPLVDGERCNPEGFAAVAIPAKYATYASRAAWNTSLNRYCEYWNQGN